MKTEISEADQVKNFRDWLKKNYGIQDYHAYIGTQTEELCIQYTAEKDHLIAEKDKEIENLQSCMVAAAEEIMSQWPAHCDKDGYGPSNLMHRLEKGIGANYSGYKSGAFTELQNKVSSLQEALRKANEFIKEVADWEEDYSSTMLRIKAKKLLKGLGVKN